MSAYNAGLVWKAMFTRMTADSALTALVSTRIYDNVPQGTVYPYVNNMNPTMVPYDVKEQEGSECTITIDVWSQYEGNKQADSILERIYTLFHRQPLGVIDGRKSFLCLCTLCSLIRQDDVHTQHGVIRFRVLTL